MIYGVYRPYSADQNRNVSWFSQQTISHKIRESAAVILFPFWKRSALFLCRTVLRPNFWTVFHNRFRRLSALCKVSEPCAVLFILSIKIIDCTPLWCKFAYISAASNKFGFKRQKYRFFTLRQLFAIVIHISLSISKSSFSILVIILDGKDFLHRQRTLEQANIIRQMGMIKHYIPKSCSS